MEPDDLDFGEPLLTWPERTRCERCGEPAGIMHPLCDDCFHDEIETELGLLPGQKPVPLARGD